MSYPWMKSKYEDMQLQCSKCGLIIGQGEPRMYNMQTKLSAHLECAGAVEMKDHMSREVPPVPEDRSAAIERLHKEKMDAFSAINESIRSLKASLTETNMLLSVAVERYVKEAPK